jgi:hypothetical protein
MKGPIPQQAHTPPHRKMKNKGVFLAFVIFLALVLLITYFAFFSSSNKNSKITGFAVSEKQNNPIKIEAELTIPNLKIRDKINKIEITNTGVNSILYVGKEKFDLTKVVGSAIIIYDFKGKISFDNKKILNLDGKASQALINGVPATSQEGDTIEIGVDENFLFNSLKIEDVSLKSLSYLSSGEIKMNDQKFKLQLHNEPITLKNFQGDLEVKDLVFQLKGNAESLETQGDFNLEVN